MPNEYKMADGSHSEFHQIFNGIKMHYGKRGHPHEQKTAKS